MRLVYEKTACPGQSQERTVENGRLGQLMTTLNTRTSSLGGSARRMRAFEDIGPGK